MPIELKLQPPKEAVEAFAARGLLVTGSWQSLWQEEHARAFTVANLARLDLLQDVYSAVDQAIKEGQDYRTFAKGLVPKLQAAGWWNQPVSEGKPLTPSRLQLIYDANLRVSYSASQWQRIQTLKKVKPFLVYSTMKDDRVRPSHRAWEGITLPVDHPWWDDHFPPKGWRCRCTVYQLSQKELEAEGREVTPDQALPTGTKTFTNRITGEVTTVPEGVDPGWAYNPGKTARENLGRTVGQKILASDPRLASMVVKTAGEAFSGPITATLGDLVDRIEAGPINPVGTQLVLGAFPPKVVDFLAERGSLETAALSLSDRELLHTVRPPKTSRDACWPLDLVRRLPAMLQAPEQVLWDTEDPAVVYVWSVEDASAKAVIRVDYRVKSEGTRFRTNLIKTLGLVQAANLAPPRYEAISLD